MKSIKYIAAFVALLSVSVEVKAETYEQCPNDNKAFISATDEFNFNLGCDGVVMAKSYFDGLGYDTDIEVRVRFDERIEFKQFEDAPAVRVYGFFNRATGLVEMSAWGTDYLHVGSRESFRNPVDEVFHRSVVTHEACHRLMDQIAGFHLSSAAQEFVAYNCQISSLPAEHRVLVENAMGREKFNMKTEINSMVHAGNPHVFGWKSYQWVQDHGDQIIHDLISGEFEPDLFLNAL